LLNFGLTILLLAKFSINSFHFHSLNFKSPDIAISTLIIFLKSRILNCWSLNWEFQVIRLTFYFRYVFFEPRLNYIGLFHLRYSLALIINYSSIPAKLSFSSIIMILSLYKTRIAPLLFIIIADWLEFRYSEIAF
jgi:hypothetical protein